MALSQKQKQAKTFEIPVWTNDFLQCISLPTGKGCLHLENPGLALSKPSEGEVQFPLKATASSFGAGNI